MPYITQGSRERLSDGSELPFTPGELNFCITQLVDRYLHAARLSYTTLNEVIGVLECTKLELYRRVAAPYEDVKCVENGDVYTAWKVRAL